MKHKKLIATVIASGMLLLSIFDPLSMATANRVHAAGAADAFNGISLARGYKDIGNHNPLITQKFSADPGVMEYNGRVYVYSTNDGTIQNYTPQTNTYEQINTINVMSSSDMVNWTDHGSIQAAGANGAAKWAKNSWAPTACHKNINGREKFFLYFANSAGGIGVLTADSPTGPWTDPIGRALITKNMPNCNVEWLFDPAVLVDTDGTGYLYFGGGVPNGKQANPGTIRVIKLGKDMTSVSGNAVTINAPWVFEDSCINKIGNTYYYSYCTNWNGGPYGNARIAYMTSNNPMGPFTFQGTCFNNPGDFFQTAGNNHHTIFSFNNQMYIFYHAEWLNKQVYGSQKGYRTTHVDTMPFSNGKFGNAKGTLKGVSQLSYLNPYQTTSFATMAWQGGVNVYGLGDAVVAYNRGDWTGVAGVNFSHGAKSITVSAGSARGAVIKVCEGNPNGPVLGYVTIPATGDNFKYTTVTADIVNANGVKDLFFVASGDVVLNNYAFSTNGNANPVTPNPPAQNNQNQGQQNLANLADGWYYIKNVNAQNYLQVDGNVAEGGRNVVLGKGDGSAGQKWYLTNLSDGTVTLKSALGFMLDVTGGKSANATNIEIWAENGKNPQQFMLKNEGNNQYGILTKVTNGSGCLDPEYGEKAAGTNIQQYTYYAAAAQLWVFEKTEVAQKPEQTKPEENKPVENKPVEKPVQNQTQNVLVADGWYYLKNVNAQKYLQVAGNNAAAVSNVEIGTGTGVAGQKWYVTNTGDGYITLKSALGDFMLDIAYGRNEDGANLQIYNSHGGDAQKFSINTTSRHGVYTLGTKASNNTKAVDVYNHGTTDGTNVCQWTLYGNPNQQWIFEPAQAPSR